MIAPNDISKVFAILDQKDAESARASFFQSYRQSGWGFSDNLIWLDLDKNGQFLRAGATDINNSTDILFNDVAQDADIAQMSKVIIGQAAKPGEIIPLQDEERFVWLLPYSLQQETNVRALLVTFALVSDSLKYFNPDAGLTDAETRIIAQLTIGMSLRDAAVQDGVSFETKRSQFKTICLKLECSGQNDVIRLALGQLVHLLTLSSNDGDRDQITEDFVADFCPAGTQFRLHRLKDGRYLRVIECGPADGRPVILFHSMTFAPLLASAAPQLQRLGIRLKMPVRPGYLEGTSTPFDVADIDQFCSDVASYRDLREHGSVPIIGHGFASPIALRFAALYPDLVTHIMMLSFPVRGERPERDSLHRRFFGSFAKLASSPEVFRMLAREFRRRYATPKAMRTALRRLFQETPADIAAFEGHGASPPAYPALQVSYQSSYIGVADDFYIFYKDIYAQGFETSQMPILTIHGAADRANPLAVMQKLQIPSRGDRLAVIEDGGQFCFVSQPDLVWDHIADWIAAEPVSDPL
ncbi:alpha/beta fold hydrolase [Cognatiyoonia sp. IB215182]|uniref:alpha/beta fold hydrolase n=1 Tax=Cognatiyoonia sp. IB215182 TaxID=3097353 RepID=UPI002A0D2449|nr:alpha/beta fold hydrolase [Cognatiyoonia sp. IB215182]MDX8355015.1 alpha/beta fold hydrolase [Cognatiyoonia sp. IB215182]